MTKDTFGAMTLALGAAGLVAIMMAHPSGADLAPGPDQAANLIRNYIVHGGAFACAVLTSFGFWRFSAPQGGLAQLALAFYLFGTLMWTSAGVMSGMVMSELMPDMFAAEGEVRADLANLANLVGRFNIAYAAVSAGLTSTALILWGLAWPERDARGWLLRVLGVVVGGATLTVFVSGNSPRLDVHGWLFIVLGQFAFSIACAAELWRGRKAG